MSPPLASGRLAACLLGLALAGCDGDPGVDAAVGSDAGELTDAAGADAGTADAARPDGATLDGGAPPLGHCFEGSVDVASGAEVTTATTTHYVVEAQTDATRAERFARILEAAWTAHAEYFGGEPTTAPLRVRFFRDRAAFEAGLAEDGLGPVDEAGGYYEPSNATAYLFDQPTRYFTRMLLIHEAAHQFHDATRAAPSLPFWYVEGVAEALSRHDWDGRCVRLGVVPLLTFEDAPADALATLEAGGISLADIVDGGTTPSRAVAWAVFRYLQQGATEAAFRRFRGRVDAGEAVATAFRDELGEPAALDPGWPAAIRSAQEPLTPVFLEWIHVDPSTVEGFADVFTVAVVKAPLTRFETSFAAPAEPGWSGGVVLGYESPSRFVALVVRDTGRLQRFDVDGGAIWNDVAAAPAPVAGRYTFAVEHGPAGAQVTLNGASFTIATGLPARSGPALDGASVRFEDLRWE